MTLRVDLSLRNIEDETGQYFYSYIKMKATLSVILSAFTIAKW